MPIYEFRCLKCDECFEFLVMNKADRVELRCPHCKSEDFERVLSAACFSADNSRSENQGPTSQTRSCPGGSCTTYEIPGPPK